MKAPDKPVRQLLDACFQTFAAALTSEQTTYMPTHIDEIRVDSRQGSNLRSHARLQASDADSVKGDAHLLDETGKVAVEIVGLRFDSIGRTANVDDLAL